MSEERLAKVPEHNVGMAVAIVRRLNEALELDPMAISAICTNRVPCNLALAEHPTIEVAKEHAGYSLGLIGLLNGVCRNFAESYGPIASVIDEEKLVGGEWPVIQKFEVVGPYRDTALALADDTLPDDYRVLVQDTLARGRLSLGHLQSILFTVVELTNRGASPQDLIRAMIEAARPAKPASKETE